MIYSWTRFFDSVYWYRRLREKMVGPLLAYLNIGTMEKASRLIHGKNERYRLELQMNKLGLYQDDGGKMPNSVLDSRVATDLDRRAKAQQGVRENSPKGLFNTWQYIALAGNIFQVLGSSLYLVDVRQRSPANIVIGFGCFFSWLNILRYLQYNAQYFTLFTSLMKSLPSVVKFMVGVMPLFLGYAFFASAVFWQSNRFSSMSRTMYTQFALLNGDGIYDCFFDLSYLNFALGHIYLYSFIILFICVVQNLFFTIVQKVYAESRKSPETGSDSISNNIKQDSEIPSVAKEPFADRKDSV